MDKLPPPRLLRKTMMLLLFPTILLPVGTVLLFLFGRFFSLSGDSWSATVLDGTAIGFSVLWFLGLVALLLCVVLETLQRPE